MADRDETKIFVYIKNISAQAAEAGFTINELMALTEFDAGLRGTQWCVTCSGSRAHRIWQDKVKRKGQEPATLFVCLECRTADVWE